MVYRRESDRMRIHACAVARLMRPDYHRCFVVTDDGVVAPPILAGVRAKK